MKSCGQLLIMAAGLLKLLVGLISSRLSVVASCGCGVVGLGLEVMMVRLGMLIWWWWLWWCSWWWWWSGMSCKSSSSCCCCSCCCLWSSWSLIIVIGLVKVWDSVCAGGRTNLFFAPLDKKNLLWIMQGKASQQTNKQTGLLALYFANAQKNWPQHFYSYTYMYMCIYTYV